MKCSCNILDFLYVSKPRLRNRINEKQNVNRNKNQVLSGYNRQSNKNAAADTPRILKHPSKPKDRVFARNVSRMFDTKKKNRNKKIVHTKHTFKNNRNKEEPRVESSESKSSSKWKKTVHSDFKDQKQRRRADKSIALKNHKKSRPNITKEQQRNASERNTVHKKSQRTGFNKNYSFNKPENIASKKRSASKKDDLTPRRSISEKDNGYEEPQTNLAEDKPKSNNDQETFSKDGHRESQRHINSDRFDRDNHKRPYSDNNEESSESFPPQNKRARTNFNKESFVQKKSGNNKRASHKQTKTQLSRKTNTKQSRKRKRDSRNSNDTESSSLTNIIHKKDKNINESDEPCLAKLQKMNPKLFEEITLDIIKKFMSQSINDKMKRSITQRQNVITNDENLMKF